MKPTARFTALVIVFLMSGCNDFTIKTAVRPDGSFERTVVCSGDSLGIGRLHLPYVFDNSWSIAWERQHESSGDFVTTAKKTYSSSEQLMEEFSKGKDSSKLQVSCRIEKRFRWFFTYFYYSETLSSYGIYRHEPVDSFFTPAEIALIKENKDSLLNKRVDDLWSRNVVDEFVMRLEAIVKAFDDPELPPTMVSAARGAIAEQIFKSKNDNSEDIALLFGKSLAPRPERKLRAAIDTVIKAMTRELEHEAELDVSYKNEVTMPGILITSNSSRIEGNTAMWECRSNKYFEVVMSAESRKANLWAVITALVVCAGLLVGLILPFLHRARIGHARVG